jgi:hypothetical protein
MHGWQLAAAAAPMATSSFMRSSISCRSLKTVGTVHTEHIFPVNALIWI